MTLGTLPTVALICDAPGQVVQTNASWHCGRMNSSLTAAKQVLVFPILSNFYFDLRPCLLHLKNQKKFKILGHIESCGTYMEH
jgi:hypothetical protein